MSTQQLPLFAPPTPPSRKSYHARSIPGPASEAAQEIKRGEEKAHEQEAMILAWFRRNPRPWSPSQVHGEVSPRRGPVILWPITSVRRAMTNLSDRKRYPFSLWPPLRKTDQRVIGPLGAKEFLWELVPAKEGM